MSYLSDTLSLMAMQAAIDEAVLVLSRIDFDAIACMGISGMLIAPQVALRMGKELIVVRKQDDSTHSDAGVEARYGLDPKDIRSFVVIDDFVASGTTVDFIRMSLEGLNGLIYKGTFRYHLDRGKMEDMRKNLFGMVPLDKGYNFLDNGTTTRETAS